MPFAMRAGQAAAPPAQPEKSPPAAKLSYNREIRPILVENCFACHGPDSASRKAGLRLDQRELAVKAGAIVPGKPAESEMVQRIFAEKLSERMPPHKSAKKLTDAQKELLRRWIADGAEYQPHWSYIAPVRPELPKVKKADWVRNPIDAFVLAKLEEKGLEPSAEADKRTLARRLSFDLTGLPPDPKEVEAFVKDTDANAYEKLVDRWLALPQYGEHRARYWLDAARYADTHGLHFDNVREMWAYRDWVISAFNRNLPFDQFTVEQLAGDLLPNPKLDQLVASGFHRCNITTNEGGSIAEEVLVMYAKDRVETTATVWLGLSAGCASCHDHKFDSIPTKEFYQFAAFFRNTTQPAMDGNVPGSAPVIQVPGASDSPRWFELLKLTGDLRSDLERRRLENETKVSGWLKSGEGKKLNEPLDPTQQLLSTDAGIKTAPKSIQSTPGSAPGSTALQFTGDEALEVPMQDFDASKPFTIGGWFKTPMTSAVLASQFAEPGRKDSPGWQFETPRGARVSFTLRLDAKNQLVVTTGDVFPGAQKWMHLAVTYNGTGLKSGLVIYVNGKAQNSGPEAIIPKDRSLKTTAPLRLGAELFKGGAMHDFRIYRSQLSPDEVMLLSKWASLRPLLATDGSKLTVAERTDLALLNALRFDPSYAKTADRLAALTKEQDAIRSRSASTHIMQERPGSMPVARVLYRGQYDQPKDEVKAGVFSMLNPLPKDAPSNRLGLAQWLVAPENPLTARVTVNRFWQEIFGNGLVRTSGDFGVSGELPSHPELLDWLAVEFVRPSPAGFGVPHPAAWDVKKLIRLMVTSATYRQSSHVTKERLEKDPANTYLSRGPRFRMDAEMIRDNALAVSGLLVKKIGGPSVKPYQPDGVWDAVAMRESNTRDYRPDKGEGLYRRSMYTFWKRAAPPASMDILNAPSREYCTVRRDRTNTPLQALVTLNDPQFVEAARHLAQAALKEGGDKDGSRIGFMAGRLVSRPFRPAEMKVVQESLSDLLAYYKAHPQDAQKLLTVGESRPDASLDGPTLAAWTMLANELMNLDEVLNK
jgi:hypothetical protein